MGTIGTSKFMAKGGKVLFALIASDGSIYGNYGPTPYLKSTYRNLLRSSQ